MMGFGYGFARNREGSLLRTSDPLFESGEWDWRLNVVRKAF